MKNKPIDQLYKKLDESIAFHDSLSQEIAIVQHDAGEQAKLISKLNERQALLESSHEPDQQLAEQFDQLKQEIDKAEAWYHSLINREKKLQSAEIHAAQSVQVIKSELKIEQLKSGHSIKDL